MCPWRSQKVTTLIGKLESSLPHQAEACNLQAAQELSNKGLGYSAEHSAILPEHITRFGILFAKALAGTIPVHHVLVYSQDTPKFKVTS